MKIACAIPARNAEQTLARVLAGVAAQSRRPDELLVADDASEDGTAKIAERAGARLIKLERNKGVAGARNALWRAADSDIILFLDADAIPEPDVVERALAGFSDDQVAGVGGRGVEAVTDDAVNRWRAEVCPQSHGVETRESDWMLMGLCFAFRRRVLEEVSGFDECYRKNGEDVDISLRIRAKGYRLRYLPDMRVTHLRRDDLGSLLSQGFRHTRYAARAIRRNEKDLLGGFFRDTVTHLGRTALSDLKSGRADRFAIGSVDLLARLAGFLVP